MRLLLAVDGSRDAETATEWVSRFLIPERTVVLVLSVAALPDLPLESGIMKDLRDTVLAHARQVGEAARASLGPRWPDATVRVSEGDPREEIVRAAEEWKAEVVVVGARGLGALKGFFLGSVSLAVARHARCPVLIVKGPLGELQNVLIALDGSPDSLEALRFLASLSLGPSVNTCLLNVVEPVRIPRSAPQFIRARLRRAAAALEQERRTQAEAMLSRAAATAGGREQAVELRVTTGTPGEAIVQAAKQGGSGLVVVGARGLGVVERLLLGSVSEKVLHDARCPVLIVKRSRGGPAGH